MAHVKSHTRKVGRKRVAVKSHRRKTKGTWKRIRSQEDGFQVYRWYERDDGAMVSVVTAPLDSELEYRFSFPTRDSWVVRGDRKIILRKTDSENIALINRQESRDLMR